MCKRKKRMNRNSGIASLSFEVVDEHTRITIESMNESINQSFLASTIVRRNTRVFAPFCLGRKNKPSMSCQEKTTDRSCRGQGECSTPKSAVLLQTRK